MVSVIQMYTWGLSICTADLGSQYLNYRLGVLVFEIQTWGLTIGPPGLDNPGFKWSGKTRLPVGPQGHLGPIKSICGLAVFYDQSDFCLM